MTMSGSKVEGYEFEGNEISNVVVGKVLEVVPHPDSDHMVITQVDVGEDEPVQIVTGASNVNVGDFVPVAKHKSTVLHEGKTVKITNSEALLPTVCFAHWESLVFLYMTFLMRSKTEFLSLEKTVTEP